MHQFRMMSSRTKKSKEDLNYLHDHDLHFF